MDIRAFVRANADRVFAVGIVIVGFVVLGVGWFGVSGTGLAAEQIPYLVSGGIGGLILIVIGCTAWVSADLQDEWRRLDAIEERLSQLPSAHPSGAFEPDALNDNGHALSTPASKSVAEKAPT